MYHYSTVNAKKKDKIIKINNIKAPIFSALYEVIYKGKPADELYTVFMTRELKSEF